jgi:hypothetical protein
LFFKCYFIYFFFLVFEVKANKSEVLFTTLNCTSNYITTHTKQLLIISIIKILIFSLKIIIPDFLTLVYQLTNIPFTITIQVILRTPSHKSAIKLILILKK